MSLDHLKPYQSLLLAKISEGEDQDNILNDVTNAIKSILRLDEDRRRITSFDPLDSGPLRVGTIRYEDRKVPGWTIDANIRDVVNQLIVICQKGDYLAIFTSDGQVKLKLKREIELKEYLGLRKLECISPGLLNAAYVTGTTKTLWLSGTHRRASVKADNKILSGINLRDALDPLGDQTFHFTAVRSLPRIGQERLLIGVAPRKSSVWSGASNRWADFSTMVTTILDHLEAIQNPDEEPLPVLAVCSSSVGGIDAPFDIGLLPPELLSDFPLLPANRREELERWAYKTDFTAFEVTSKKMEAFTFRATLALEDEELGRLEFVIDFRNPEKVRPGVNEISVVPGKEELFKQAKILLRKTDWLKIWFESGHTICDGAVFRMRHRDIPFNRYIWADFTGYDVSKEKPEELLDTGTNYLLPVGEERSLFDWVVENWPLDTGGPHPGGWLACDDGSMEIADFIHLDHRAVPPKLSLIHVKGAGSSSPTREISVSNYEVVAGQAVKNLRYVEREFLRRGLESGLLKNVSELVWLDRIRKTREEMLAVLDNLGANYTRQVVVLQPHLTEANETIARGNRQSANFKRLTQLDTLLISAESSCRDLQAAFIVIGEKARPTTLT